MDASKESADPSSSVDEIKSVDCPPKQASTDTVEETKSIEGQNATKESGDGGNEIVMNENGDTTRESHEKIVKQTEEVSSAKNDESGSRSEASVENNVPEVSNLDEDTGSKSENKNKSEAQDNYDTEVLNKKDSKPEDEHESEVENINDSKPQDERESVVEKQNVTSEPPNADDTAESNETSESVELAKNSVADPKSEEVPVQQESVESETVCPEKESETKKTESENGEPDEVPENDVSKYSVDESDSIEPAADDDEKVEQAIEEAMKENLEEDETLDEEKVVESKNEVPNDKDIGEKDNTKNIEKEIGDTLKEAEKALEETEEALKKTFDDTEEFLKADEKRNVAKTQSEEKLEEQKSGSVDDGNETSEITSQSVEEQKSITSAENENVTSQDKGPEEEDEDEKNGKKVGEVSDSEEESENAEPVKTRQTLPPKKALRGRASVDELMHVNGQNNMQKQNQQDIPPDDIESQLWAMEHGDEPPPPDDNKKIEETKKEEKSDVEPVEARGRKGRRRAGEEKPRKVSNSRRAPPSPPPLDDTKTNKRPKRISMRKEQPETNTSQEINVPMKKSPQKTDQSQQKEPLKKTEPTVTRLESKSAFSEEGRLLWAKIRGYSYWPSIVTVDPIDGVTCMTPQPKKAGENPATKVHVHFLGYDNMRGWIPESAIIEYSGRAAFEKLAASVSAQKKKDFEPTKRYKAAFDKAVKAADEVAPLAYDDRLHQLGLVYIKVPQSGDEEEVEGKDEKPSTSKPKKTPSSPKKRKPPVQDEDETKDTELKSSKINLDLEEKKTDANSRRRKKVTDTPATPEKKAKSGNETPKRTPGRPRKTPVRLQDDKGEDVEKAVEENAEEKSSTRNRKRGRKSASSSLPSTPTTPKPMAKKSKIEIETPKALAKEATPVVAKKSTPVVAKKSTPVVAKKSTPVVAKKSTPIVAKKSTPLAAKKTTPVVAKKSKASPDSTTKRVGGKAVTKQKKADETPDTTPTKGRKRPRARLPKRHAGVVKSMKNAFSTGEPVSKKAKLSTPSTAEVPLATPLTDKKARNPSNSSAAGTPVKAFLGGVGEIQDLVKRPSSSATSKDQIEETAPTVESDDELASDIEEEDDQSTVGDEPKLGSLAWGRMPGFPFWPCFVTRSAEKGGEYKRVHTKRVDFHVQFFNWNNESGWVTKIMPWCPLGEYKTKANKVKKNTSEFKHWHPIGKQMTDKWRAAYDEADGTKSLSRLERYHFYKITPISDAGVAAVGDGASQIDATPSAIPSFQSFKAKLANPSGLSTPTHGKKIFYLKPVKVIRKIQTPEDLEADISQHLHGVKGSGGSVPPRITERPLPKLRSSFVDGKGTPGSNGSASKRYRFFKSKNAFNGNSFEDSGDFDFTDEDEVTSKQPRKKFYNVERNFDEEFEEYRKSFADSLPPKWTVCEKKTETCGSEESDGGQKRRKPPQKPTPRCRKIEGRRLEFRSPKGIVFPSVNQIVSYLFRQNSFSLLDSRPKNIKSFSEEMIPDDLRNLSVENERLSSGGWLYLAVDKVRSKKSESNLEVGWLAGTVRLMDDSAVPKQWVVTNTEKRGEDQPSSLFTYSRKTEDGSKVFRDKISLMCYVKPHEQSPIELEYILESLMEKVRESNKRQNEDKPATRLPRKPCNRRDRMARSYVKTPIEITIKVSDLDSETVVQELKLSKVKEPSKVEMVQLPDLFLDHPSVLVEEDFEKKETTFSDLYTGDFIAKKLTKDD